MKLYKAWPGLLNCDPARGGATHDKSLQPAENICSEINLTTSCLQGKHELWLFHAKYDLLRMAFRSESQRLPFSLKSVCKAVYF